MKEEEIFKEVNELFDKLRKLKLVNRFNYSVGYKNGSCFGSSFDKNNRKETFKHGE